MNINTDDWEIIMFYNVPIICRLGRCALQNIITREVGPKVGGGLRRILQKSAKSRCRAIEDALERFNDKKTGRVLGSMRLYQDTGRAGDISSLP